MFYLIQLCLSVYGNVWAKKPSIVNTAFISRGGVLGKWGDFYFLLYASVLFEFITENVYFFSLN